MNCIILHQIYKYEFQDGKENEVIDTDNTDSKIIRVLIRDKETNEYLHKDITLYCHEKYIVESADKKREMQKEKKVNCKDFGIKEGEHVEIYPKEKQNDIYMEGYLGYRGKLMIEKEENGYYMINELPLEEYLYDVIPSEMPSNYPMEALKAQAVCARTYALHAIRSKRMKEFNADLDDSTAFQVYNQIEGNERTKKAVDDTRGIIMMEENNLADIQYYATSCGMGDYGVISLKNEKRVLSAEQKFHKFINKRFEEDLECNQPWYRWQYSVGVINEKEFISRIREQYRRNPNSFLSLPQGNELLLDKEFGAIKNIVVQSREKNGRVKELYMEGSNYAVVICDEYNIRYILSNGKSKVIRQDGTECENTYLLPSAFFELTLKVDKDNRVGYAINGGGYGHGRGMSQNAAKYMAEKNKNYKDIIGFFYPNIELKNIKECQ